MISSYIFNSSSFITLVFFIFLIFPRQNKEYVNIDIIEYNETIYTLFDNSYKQYIFWNWSPDYKRYDCHGWALDKHCSITKVGDIYYLTYIRGDKIIKVKSKIFRQTKTKSDPERQNIKLFPEEFRRFR
jgi:hypothetical protein